LNNRQAAKRRACKRAPLPVDRSVDDLMLDYVIPGRGDVGIINAEHPASSLPIRRLSR